MPYIQLCDDVPDRSVPCGFSVLRAVVHPVLWLANAGDDENADARRKLRYRSALLRVSVGAGAVTADSVRFESETTNGKSIELHSFVCFARTDAIIGLGS